MINTQKLSVRLLHKGIAPTDAVREGTELAEWPTLEGALISLNTLGSGAPKWAKFP